MYGNNTNMFPSMMGQQGGVMFGQQMGVGQMGTQMANQMANQTGQPIGQMHGQFGGQIQQLQNPPTQQQGTMQQPTAGSVMIPSMSGMAGMAMPGMAGINSGSAAGTTTASVQGLLGQAGAGMMGPQNTGMMGQQSAGMMAQHGAGMLGQQGMTPANWQTMAAGNPQAMAAMQAYMQQYAMRMAAYQRMAAAASAGGMAAMGGVGHMGAMGGVGAMGGMGPMGVMSGMAGPMGTMGMMAQMNQMHHLRTAQHQQGGQEGGENSCFWKTRICNKWKLGNCPYGDSCKYAHGDGDLRPPVLDGAKGGTRNQKTELSMGQAMEKRTEPLKKTRVCEEFMKSGSCKYGDKCTYAHGLNEIRQVPNTSSSQQVPQAGKEGLIHKTRLCERFMASGSCPYGAKCTFAHGHHELRSKQGGGAVAGGHKNQGHLKQRKQQKGDGTSSGASMPAITGAKRDREENATAGSGGATSDAGGNAVDKADAGEQVKRQHLASPDGERSEHQEPLQEGEPQQHPQQAGDGESRWGWGSSPSPKRDGVDTGDDIDVGDEQHDGLDAGDQHEEEDGVGQLDGAAGLPPGGADGDGDLDSSAGAEAATAPIDDGITAGGAASTGTVTAASGVELECRLCSAMVKAGRDNMLMAVQQLGSLAAQKLGAMILGFGTPRFEQLWHRLSFGQLQAMLAKSELSVADRIELLKAVSFHTHARDEEREKLESQKYVSQGLPPDVADFVAMVLDGKEGSTQMAEYFAALEVCKSLYGVTEDEYFNVSSTMANLFMNM